MLPFFPPVLQTPTLTLPAYTAYLDPNPDGADIARDGTITGWSSPKTWIEWGGYFAQSGQVHVAVNLASSGPADGSYELKCGSTTRHASAQGSVIDFGMIEIRNPGWDTFWLKGDSKSGAGFGAVRSLELTGDAVQGSKFNLKERRNAASVHLLYPVSDQAEWFYNEVTAKEDPQDTYYMACGFNRGYFGMQVNGPHERRVIFSVWDSGHEAVDRRKVSPEDMVQLLAKGPGVYAGGFGNEGTGGHSHLVFPWITGETEKFLVHAEANGDHTTYTAYFRSPEDHDWRLIASFSAPHDGKLMRGLYSFVEDFDGANGNLKRKALYGPAWIWSKAKGWGPLTTAKFSHDGTGGKDRFDYEFGLEHGRYFLQNGGFEGSSPAYGTVVHLEHPPKEPPQVDFSELEKMAQAAG